MARIVRARHVGYTPAGVPIVRNLPDVTCLPLPEFLAFRHAGYTAAGLPLAAYAWACCDAYCTDEEVSGETCYVEAECWPFGPGPGIARRLTIYMVEVTNCVSGRRKKAVLEYDDDPTSPAWVGEIELRDKTIELRFTCNPVPDPDANDKFTLSWSNCDVG